MDKSQVNIYQIEVKNLILIQ